MPSDALLVILNAIYFKGLFVTKFDVAKTEDQPFHLLDGSKQTCKLMSMKKDFSYMQGKNFQAVELPYKGGNISMSIMLPNNPGQKVGS